MDNTPKYIKSLLAPTVKKSQGRKVWSIDLQTVWVPFFTATNAMGDTAIPSDAIGAPLRLGYDKAGAVRFSQSGRPVIRVAKELADNIRLVRDNFTANLLNYAGGVSNEHPEAYGAQIEMARKAGEPVLAHDKAELTKAVIARMEAEAREAKAKAEPVKAEPEPVAVG